jgi:hypothetical protein
MNRFNFTNIHSAPWLNVSIIADDIQTAIKKFNLMWGENVKYNVSAGPIPFAMQTIF